MNNTIIQQQYIAQWHDSFVSYIGSLLGVIAGLWERAEATMEDKHVLEALKGMLTGKDAADVERDLAAGVVKRSTLDKIVKLNKDMADKCLDHIHMDNLVRDFWRQMAHIQIEYNKRSEVQRLDTLQIPITED